MTTRALIIKPDIKVDKVIQSEDLEFIRELFEGGKRSGIMDCEISTKFTRDVRKFKNKTVSSENLEILYIANGFDYSSEKLVISVGNMYGHRVTTDHAHGPVEEFRIDLEDYYDSYIKFSHDGKGKLTGFVYGDAYHVSPCQVNKSNNY